MDAAVDEKQRFHPADVEVDLRAVVLVEGTSDKLAVETLARADVAI